MWCTPSGMRSMIRHSLGFWTTQRQQELQEGERHDHDTIQRPTVPRLAIRSTVLWPAASKIALSARVVPRIHAYRYVPRLKVCASAQRSFLARTHSAEEGMHAPTSLRPDPSDEDIPFPCVAFACCVVCILVPSNVIFLKLYWQATCDQVWRSIVVIGISRPLVALVLRPRLVACRSALLLLHVLVRQLRELREPRYGD